MYMKPVERVLLIILTTFLAVTAIAGGMGLLTGVISLPLAWLDGSPFGSYAIPGLTLLLIVGGSASSALVLLLLRHRLAVMTSVVAGAMIIAFEIVEVLVVGSQPGLMRSLQICYVLLGLVIAALGGWSLTRTPLAGEARVQSARHSGALGQGGSR